MGARITPVCSAIVERCASFGQTTRRRCVDLYGRVRRFDYRRLKPFQRRLVAGTLALLLLGGSLLVYRQATSLYTVEIGGDVIGVARSKRAVTALIDSLSAEMSNGATRRVWLDGDITYRRIHDRSLQPDDPEALKSKLSRYLPLMTEAWVVMVNENPVVGLATKEEATGIIEDIKNAYQQTLTAKGAEVMTIRLQQTVEVKKSACKVADLRAADDAKQILLRGTDRLVSTTVQRGDTFVAIAKRAGVSVDQLLKANPEVKPSALKPGQEINLVKSDPYVNLVSVERRTFTQVIPYSTVTTKDSNLWPWVRKVTQQGKSGQLQRTVEITRQDGKEVSSKNLETTVLSQPVTELAVVGTKQIPDRGTGSFVWPTLGTITSRFGYRHSGFHSGLDIGAPTGTSVLAADSGMVTAAGWSGNLGRRIVIDHGGGKMTTTYAHLSSILVKVGDTIDKGQLIGRVGNTGRSTGPHLHFEVRVNGKAINPLNYYPQ